MNKFFKSTMSLMLALAIILTSIVVTKPTEVQAAKKNLVSPTTKTLTVYTQYRDIYEKNGTASVQLKVKGAKNNKYTYKGKKYTIQWEAVSQTGCVEVNKTGKVTAEIPYGKPVTEKVEAYIIADKGREVLGSAKIKVVRKFPSVSKDAIIEQMAKYYNLMRAQPFLSIKEKKDLLVNYYKYERDEWEDLDDEYYNMYNTLISKVRLMSDKEVYNTFASLTKIPDGTARDGAFYYMINRHGDTYKKWGKALKLNWSTPHAFKKLVNSKKINYKGATIQTKLKEDDDACNGFYKSMVYALYYDETWDSISVNAKTFDWRTFQPGDAMESYRHIEMFWCYTDASKNARYSEWNSDCKYAVIMTGNPGDNLDIHYYEIDSASGIGIYNGGYSLDGILRFY